MFHHWFRLWLGTDQATNHYFNRWWLFYWQIYASLGLNESIWSYHLVSEGISIAMIRWSHDPGPLISLYVLTHWGQVTHICVSKLTIIGSDNGLSPGRCQAIILKNAGILLIGPLGNFNEISIEIPTFSMKKIRLKVSSAKCCPFRLGLNVLKAVCFSTVCIPTAHDIISTRPIQ